LLMLKPVDIGEPTDAAEAHNLVAGEHRSCGCCRCKGTCSDPDSEGAPVSHRLTGEPTPRYPHRGRQSWSVSTGCGCRVRPR